MKYREIIFFIKLKFNLRFSYMLTIHTAASILFEWLFWISKRFSKFP